ncbi:MAG: hypothetical protein IPK26_23880 [Planctomycetes bacterium]|nr:hypothetical protein [Planctomycetota bacterium]
MNKLQIVSLLLLGACGTHSAGTSAAAVDLPFERQLLAAAKTYREWSRVSDQANWAPTMCRIPPAAGVRRSDSSDADTHGRKLYFLFAKDAASYRGLWDFERQTKDEQAAAVRALQGQVLVKQSWHPVEVDRASVPELRPQAPGGREHPEEFAVDGDRAFRTGQQADLFVMLKLDPQTPGTDQGWVYGTLTPDGSRVTASGRLQSCMECHVDAPRDRLFGPMPPRTK